MNERDIDTVNKAVQRLRSINNNNKYRDQLTADMVNRIDPHQLLTHVQNLLDAVHEDWFRAAAIRSTYAGYDTAYGKAERAAHQLALLVLDRKPPCTPSSPPASDSQ